MTEWEHLAVAGGETRATTDDDHLLDPGRLKPRDHEKPRQDQDPPLRPDAIEALLRQFRPAIVRYCRARLAHNRTATGSLDEDDVAQEVCLALVSALPSYRDMGRPFGAFVFAIAAHKVADAARGAARAPLPVPVLPDLPDRCPGPEETVLQNVDARLVRALLASLPAPQRRLLLLRVVAGLSAEDTGYVLDMSPGAVRVAQHRALARLRTLAAHEDSREDSHEDPANRTGEQGTLGPGQPWSQ